MIRAVRQQPVAWGWLTVAWVVMWGNLSLANVLGGMVVGALLLAVLRMPPISIGVRLHPLRALVLLVRFLLDVATPEQAEAFRARVLAQERRVLAALSAPGEPVVHPAGTS